MIDLENERTELTLQEVITRVTDLQRVIGDIRKQKEEALATRTAQRLEKENVDGWRREVSDSVRKSGSELEESIEELELQLHRVCEARNKKIIMHKKQRERLKREIAQMEIAGQQMVNFELELLEAVAADTRRLADHSRLVHEATLSGLNDKMESLVTLGERQYSRNQELLVNLEAEVMQQRSVFWSNQKLKRYGQESTLIAALPSESDVEIHTAINRVKAGDVVTRFNKSGKQEEIWMQVDSSCNYLTWQRLDADGGALDMTASRLSLQMDVVDVIFGTLAPGFFLSKIEPPLSWLGLSIIEKSGGVINIASSDEETALLWFLGLQALVPSDTRLDGSPRNRNVTRGDVLWIRARMKIDSASRIHSLPPPIYLARKILACRRQMGEHLEHLREVVLPSETLSHKPEAKRDSINFSRVDPLGTRALQVALREKVITQHDLIHLTDTELRRKLIDAADYCIPLQTLFRDGIRVRGGSNNPRRSSKASVGSVGKFVSRKEMNGAIQELVSPRPVPGQTSPRTSLLLAQQEEAFPDASSIFSPRSGGEGIGVVLLQQAMKEKVITLEDLTRLSDAELQAKVIAAVEHSEGLRTLLRGYLKARGKLPTTDDSSGEDSNGDDAISTSDGDVNDADDLRYNSDVEDADVGSSGLTQEQAV